MNRGVRPHCLAVLLIITLNVTGCLSFSTTHTARTTEPGKIRISSGFGLFSRKSIGNDSEYPSLYWEFGIRYGLNPKVDLGGEIIAFSGNKRADVKYNLVNLNNYAFAIGIEGSSWNYDSKNNFKNYSYPNSYTVVSHKISTIDLSIPFYNTLYLNEIVVLNFIPRIGYRFKKYTRTFKCEPIDTQTCNVNPEAYNEPYIYDEKIKPLLIGIDLGVIFGKDLGVVIESGLYNGLPVFQFGFSFFMGSESMPSLVIPNRARNP